MTREQKYDAVNRCETFKELAETILSFADSNGMINGRTRKFSAVRMSSYCNKQTFNIQPNLLTREFGIRQQAFYLSYYSI